MWTAAGYYELPGLSTRCHRCEINKSIVTTRVKRKKKTNEGCTQLPPNLTGIFPVNPQSNFKMPREPATVPGELPIYDASVATFWNEALWQQDDGQQLAQIYNCTPFYELDEVRTLYQGLSKPGNEFMDLDRKPAPYATNINFGQREGEIRPQLTIFQKRTQTVMIDPLCPGRHILEYFTKLRMGRPAIHVNLLYAGVFAVNMEPITTHFHKDSVEFSMPTGVIAKFAPRGLLSQKGCWNLMKTADTFMGSQVPTYKADGGYCSSANALDCGKTLQKSHCDILASSALNLEQYGKPTYERADHFRPGTLIMPLFVPSVFPDYNGAGLCHDAGTMVIHTYPSHGQLRGQRKKMDKGLRIELRPPYGLWMDGCKVHAGGAHPHCFPPEPCRKQKTLRHKMDTKGLTREERKEHKELEAAHKKCQAAWHVQPEAHLRLHFHFDHEDMPRMVNMSQVITDAFNRGEELATKKKTARDRLGLPAQTKQRSDMDMDLWQMLEDNRTARKRKASRDPPAGVVGDGEEESENDESE